MTPYSLAFLSGILLLQFFPQLPPLYSLAFILPSCLLLFVFKRFQLLTAVLGFAWCLCYAHTIADFSLPAAWEGKTLWVQGKIASLPRVSPQQTTFNFQTSTLSADKQTIKAKTLINLSWHHPPQNLTHQTATAVRVGDEWLFPVRLKRIHSTLNPGGFDYEAWAFQNGLRAKGYLDPKEKPVFIAAHPFVHPMDRLRQHLQEQAQSYLPRSRTAPWLLALMIGERVGIPPAEWEVLRNTGTNHLMAIAGLHIGFLSALAYGLVIRLWRRPQWIFLLPAPQAAAGASLLMAGLYSGLAGFSLPTQRALFMISVYLVTTICRRVIPLWQAWSLALMLVLLFNPLSVLSASFWLSFTTLALILYGLGGRIAPHHWWWKWGRPQWVIALGLLPLSLWIFTQYSLVSFFANAIAIPWVGFLILPLCFVSVIFLLLCPLLAHLTLMLADKSLSLLWSLLIWFSALPGATWQQVVPHYGYLFAAFVGVLILLVPAGFPGRYFGLFWLLPLLVFQPSQPAYGDLHFSLLDVGQGLSAVFQTQNHTLVFDTGARLGPDLDMGESVVLPFLRSQGIKQVDVLVISHGDNDHSGGAQALLKQMPVSTIKTSVPWLFPSQPASYCLAGQHWDWDGVHFAFLHPTPTQLNLGNDSCCVLQITAGKKRILIAGDIEKPAEKFLLANPENDLAAEILVAPHHGSKTSGYREFIGRVHPQYVLFALGYRNRFHFPHPSVVQTYQAWGVIQYDTSLSGAILFTLKQGLLPPPELYRQAKARYWRATG